MWTGLLFLFFGQLSSSVGPTFIKIGIREISPLTFTDLRFFLATVIFLPVFLSRKRKALQIKDYAKLLLVSFFLFINVAFYSLGIRFTTVIMAQTLYLATPILVGILAHFTLGEQISKHKLIGMLIALGGVLYLISQSVTKQTHITFGSPLGNGLMLIGMVGYSLFILYSKKLHSHYSSTTISFYNFLFIALLLLLLVPFEHQIKPLTHVSSQAVLSVFLVSIFTSVLFYFLMQLGIKKAGAFTASLFQYTGPVFAAFWSIPLLHEKITWSFFIGGIVILLGVFYATTYPMLRRVIRTSEAAEVSADK